MINYTLSRAEQETNILFSRADTQAVMYTADRAMMKKMDALCEQYPMEYRCIWTDEQILGDGLPMGKKYMYPIKNIRHKKPATEAQRKAARENMIRINSKPE